MFRKQAAIAATIMSAAVAAQAPKAPAMDPKLLQEQVILHRVGFSPGVVDGQEGFTLKLALSGLQRANGLP